jgi:peptidyl-prolyl cis-trans isomerase D
MLKDAFAQNAGETSPIEDDKAGNYYVVRTDDIKPAGVEPFDAVKDDVAKAWMAHARMEKARSEADAIAKDLGAGKPVSSFAGEEGASVRTSSPLSQLGDTDALLPPDIIAQAFRLKKGETARGEADNKQIVVRLAEIADADTGKDDPRKGQIEGEIRREAAGELLDQYIRHLYLVFPVSTDAALLDHMRQQGD